MEIIGIYGITSKRLCLLLFFLFSIQLRVLHCVSWHSVRIVEVVYFLTCLPD